MANWVHLTNNQVHERKRNNCVWNWVQPKRQHDRVMKKTQQNTGVLGLFWTHAHVVQGSEFCHGKSDRCHLRQTPKALGGQKPYYKRHISHMQQNDVFSLSYSKTHFKKTTMLLLNFIFPCWSQEWDLNKKIGWMDFNDFSPRSCEPMVSSRAHSCVGYEMILSKNIPQELLFFFKPEFHT